jgi:hypothetical protein
MLFGRIASGDVSGESGAKPELLTLDDVTLQAAGSGEKLIPLLALDAELV